MNELEILIADYSLVYTKMFIRAVTEADKAASVSSVTNGDEALTLINHKNYDIIIIDAEIPGTGLIELIKTILLKNPMVYILAIARPSVSNNNLFREALSNGATECMTKPIYKSYGENFYAVKLKMRYILKKMKNNRSENIIKPETVSVKTRKTVRKDAFHPEIVLIAASTGGPLALNSILPKLRDDFPVPVLVVQHIPSYFTETLAHHLNNKSGLKVKIAENREIVTAGTVYMAPGGVHMKLNAENKIKLDDSPPVNGLRPAADVLFESVAESFSGSKVLVVILTGMGNDGKKGLAGLKAKRDCFCLAQSEETCVVYGMPRSAVESGFADKILDLDKILHEIESLCYIRK